MNKDSMTQMTLVDFLELTASDAPAPGGGSVAALAAGLGAALGRMVLCLSYGKKSYEALPDETRKIWKLQRRISLNFATAFSA